MTTLARAVTAADYQAAFELARSIDYPSIDAFEDRCGYRISRPTLEHAARVLACPVKANPPHWQHGRVIYAAARKFLEGKPSGCWAFVDIGSAKGFSALCALWALMDHAGGAIVGGAVTSVDVLPPLARVRRNTLAEVDGLKTLPEILDPWPEARGVDFLESTGVAYLESKWQEIDFAFIDGKHEGHVVRQEGKLLAERQESGDLAIFDDCQIPAVSVAVVSLEEFYKFEYLTAGPREYAVGRRR